MQLVPFRSFLCFGSVAAIFDDGGSVVEFIFRIVNALYIHEVTRHFCKTFAKTLKGNWVKVKSEKMVMKGNNDVKIRAQKYCVSPVCAREHL